MESLMRCLHSSTTIYKQNIVVNVVLVHHFLTAEIAWHERRKEWVGDRSENVQREPKEPILSWTMTYEDLLTAEPFQQPIPLAVRKWWTSWLISGMKMASMIRHSHISELHFSSFFAPFFQGFYSFLLPSNKLMIKIDGSLVLYILICNQQSKDYGFFPFFMVICGLRFSFT
ncbi:hypothetical protein IC575_010132 [Cucumis melo]